MQSEFEQLLEDLWDGRLDERGRRRLGELCAANPALARRLRQEQNLNGLLSHCGPNHAPDDLAYAVLARLEPRRSSYLPRRRTPWFAWIFRPAIGAALAFCVMAAIGIEAGILIHQHQWSGPGGEGAGSGQSVSVQLTRGDRKAPPSSRTDGTKNPTLREIASNSNKTKPPRATPAPVKRNSPQNPTTPQMTAQHPAVSAPAPNQVPPVPQTTPRTEEFNAPAPQADPDRMLALNNTPPVRNTNPQAPPAATPAVPLSQGTPPAIPGAGAPAAPVVGTQAPPVKAGEAKVERRAPARQDLADRQVAMEIFLTPSTRRPEGETAPPPRNAAPKPSYAQSFVQEDESKPRPQALSLKDIEVTLYAIMGEHSAEKVASRQVDRNAWEVRARLTPEQFRSFTADLRKMSILPGESVTSDKAPAAAAATPAPSFTTNHYEVLRGKQWFTPSAATEALAAARQSSGTSAPLNRGALRVSPTADGKLGITIRVQLIGSPVNR